MFIYTYTHIDICTHTGSLSTVDRTSDVEEFQHTSARARYHGSFGLSPAEGENGECATHHMCDSGNIPPSRAFER